ncbi:MAG TPA: NRDE family protein [Flavobacteriales bacterium]|nr:NRDE family protein [Flavobacteriales bacterium]HMR28703.1 NRDE family protein [Flavobacteriales bacterium]
MCTVSYSPLRGGGHVITSNRDERTARHGRPAGPWMHEGAVLLAPKDALTGTTWIAASSLGRTVCLLNGAEGTMHFAEQPARSRGTVLLEMASALDALVPLVQSELTDMHPFTLISAEHHTLWMLRWDGRDRCVCTLDTERPQVWSSPTLYDESVRAERDAHFDRMVKRTSWPTPDDVWEFHNRPHLSDGEQAVVMEREGDLRTVSITQAIMEPSGLVTMRYLDLITGEERTRQLSTKPFDLPSAANA